MDAERAEKQKVPKWLIVAGVLGVLYAVSQLSGGDTTFSGHAVSFTPESSAYLRVNLEVRNTGDEAGSPGCTVGAYIGETRVGFDILDGDEVEPGGTLRGNMVLTIENESAQAVDGVRVTDC